MVYRVLGICGGDILDGTMIGGVERSHTIEPIGNNIRNPDNDSAEIIELERGADPRVRQLGEFDVININGSDMRADTLLMVLETAGIASDPIESRWDEGTVRCRVSPHRNLGAVT
jgi:hypothetical protein